MFDFDELMFDFISVSDQYQNSGAHEPVAHADLKSLPTKIRKKTHIVWCLMFDVWCLYARLILPAEVKYCFCADVMCWFYYLYYISIWWGGGKWNVRQIWFLIFWFSGFLVLIFWFSVLFWFRISVFFFFAFLVFIFGTVHQKCSSCITCGRMWYRLMELRKSKPKMSQKQENQKTQKQENQKIKTKKTENQKNRNQKTRKPKTQNHKKKKQQSHGLAHYAHVKLALRHRDCEMRHTWISPLKAKRITRAHKNTARLIWHVH